MTSPLGVRALPGAALSARSFQEKNAKTTFRRVEWTGLRVESAAGPAHSKVSPNASRR